MNLPAAYTDRMQRMLGGEYRAFLAGLEQPRHRGLRVNTQKISPEEFEHIAPFPLERIPWIPNGFCYPEEVRPARHPYYAAGLYYLQEPSAMTPAAVLPVKPGDRVLDLCAAPGGKATELAAKLQGQGLLVANDINTARSRALLRNLELSGAANILVTNETPERLAEAFPAYFDCILTDVPCSGEGMFRKEPAAAELWSPERVRSFAAQQSQILAQAYRMLRPGGLLMYSTCTFSPEEDEQQISHFLEAHEDIHVTDTGLLCGESAGFAGGRPDWLHVFTGEMREEPVSVPGKHPREEELKKCVRIWPHRMPGEGHFLALMKKDSGMAGSGEEPRELRMNAGRERKTCGAGKMKKVRSDSRGKERKSGQASVFPGSGGLNLIRPFAARVPGVPFREGTQTGADDFSDPAAAVRYRIETRGERAYMVQELPDGVRGLHFLRNGLYLGDWKKNRFEPSQPLAMAQAVTEGSPAEACPALLLPAADERLSAYLRGESLGLTADEAGQPADGWLLVCAGRYPLGWGKKTGRTVKNKYPQSWRQ